MELADYLKSERGRIASVADAVGVAAAFLSQIANGVRPCPANSVPAVEKACEFNVRRWDLRPDDWHRIWPELIGTAGAPVVQAFAAEASDAG